MEILERALVRALADGDDRKVVAIAETIVTKRTTPRLAAKYNWPAIVGILAQRLRQATEALGQNPP